MGEMEMTKTTRVHKSEVLVETGPLAEVADKAMAAGYRYVMAFGKIFEIESGRRQGSSLGLRWLKGAELALDGEA